MKEKTNDKLQTPYELFGVECGDGWKGLLKPIFDYIEKYNSEPVSYTHLRAHET